MVKLTLLRTAAFAALAVTGVLAAPVQAQDVDRENARSEARAARMEARSEARAERQQQRAQVQSQAQVQTPQQQRSSEGGWRGQRSAGEGQQAARSWNGGDGQRSARTWNRSETAQQTAPSWRGGDAAGSTERNRTYSDGARNRTYRSDGTSWRDRTRDQQQAYRQGYRNGTRADSYRDRRDQSQAYRQGYNTGSRDWSGSRYSGSQYRGDYRRWDRNDWRRDSRYNWYGYRNQYRDLFRAGRYYSPYRNYSYSRLSIGFFLEPLFYGNNYWINDPWQYRLPEVYGPYRWVRYYDDVLLVDIYSGEVVDVIHDFFW